MCTSYTYKQRKNNEMARFEKGNKLGNRFTSDNQPKKNGRKPSLYKYIRKLTGLNVNIELEKSDYLKIIQFLMEKSPKELKPFLQDERGQQNEDTPMWILAIISAINSTVEMLFDRVFGKAVQPIEGDISSTVTGGYDFSKLSDEELNQYNALLEKLKK